jgi:hypothetical protein
MESTVSKEQEKLAQFMHGQVPQMTSHTGHMRPGCTITNTLLKLGESDPNVPCSNLLSMKHGIVVVGKGGYTSTYQNVSINPAK